jgi:hypothetical protein
MIPAQPVIPGLSLLRLSKAQGCVLANDAVLNGYLCLATWDWETQRRNSQETSSIKLFSAKFQVPAPPTLRSSQTIFLFSGMQPSAESPVKSILQPVLQWGSSNTGGGQFWSVSSWYVKGSSGNLDVAVNTHHIRVEPGQDLIGLIDLVEKDGDIRTYTCGFQGIDGTTISIQTSAELVQAGIALEAYKLDGPRALPDQLRSTFYPVQVGLENGTARPKWDIRNASKDLADAVAVAHSNIEDELDIQYHPPSRKNEGL